VVTGHTIKYTTLLIFWELLTTKLDDDLFVYIYVFMKMLAFRKERVHAFFKAAWIFFL
jgi:hypothetical protein